VPGVYYPVCAVLTVVSWIVGLWACRKKRDCPLADAMKQLKSAISSCSKHDCQFLLDDVKQNARKNPSWKRLRHRSLMLDLDLLEERLHVLESAYDFACCKNQEHSECMSHCRKKLTIAYEKLAEVSERLTPHEIKEKEAFDREFDEHKQRIERERQPQWQLTQLVIQEAQQAIAREERDAGKLKMLQAKLRAQGLSDEQLGIVSDDNFDKLLNQM
jgi:hypothetical protein